MIGGSCRSLVVKKRPRFKGICIVRRYSAVAMRHRACTPCSGTPAGRGLDTMGMLVLPPAIGMPLVTPDDTTPGIACISDNTRHKKRRLFQVWNILLPVD